MWKNSKTVYMFIYVLLELYKLARQRKNVVRCKATWRGGQGIVMKLVDDLNVKTNESRKRGRWEMCTV